MLSIVLIEPQNSANIGSIARVMENFEVSDLILIDPKCEINEESRRLAKSAQEVLKGTKIRSLSILKEFDCVIGTTSKLGSDFNIPRSPITPSQLAKKLREIKGRKIALMLGRESDGLRNKEIELCDFLVTIPTGKQYNSMNISHALAVLLYEIKKDDLTDQLIKPYTPISAKEKEQIMKYLEISLNKMDFLNEQKRETQRAVWQRMVSRSFMTRREAFALLGFLKKIK